MTVDVGTDAPLQFGGGEQPRRFDHTTLSVQPFRLDRIQPGRRVEALAEQWRPTHPHVAAELDEHPEECVACDAFPPSYRTRLRTTNGLERLDQELKRRTWVVRIFPNREACLRLATALRAELSEDWITGPRYLDIAELRRWQRDHESREVQRAAGSSTVGGREVTADIGLDTPSTRSRGSQFLHHCLARVAPRSISCCS